MQICDSGNPSWQVQPPSWLQHLFCQYLSWLYVAPVLPISLFETAVTTTNHNNQQSPSLAVRGVSLQHGEDGSYQTEESFEQSLGEIGESNEHGETLPSLIPSLVWEMSLNYSLGTSIVCCLHASATIQQLIMQVHILQRWSTLASIELKSVVEIRSFVSQLRKVSLSVLCLKKDFTSFLLFCRNYWLQALMEQKATVSFLKQMTSSGFLHFHSKYVRAHVCTHTLTQWTVLQSSLLLISDSLISTSSTWKQLIPKSKSINLAPITCRP